MKPIILQARTLTGECIGTVRLTPEAERVVRRLNIKTGLPIRQIVSEKEKSALGAATPSGTKQKHPSRVYPGPRPDVNPIRLHNWDGYMIEELSREKYEEEKQC